MNLATILQEAAEGAQGTTQGTGMAERAQEYLFEYGPKIAAGIVVFLVGKWVAGLVVRLVGKMLRTRQVDETLAKFLCNILRMALIVIVIISAFDTMGVETTSFVAVLGAATLAIGFALQGSLSNFAAGVLLILFRPFKAGDFVETGGTSGIVEEVGVFATTLRTPDNKKVIVPNNSVTGNTITNYSAKETRRVDLVFGIGYDDDIKRAKEVLQRIVSAHDKVLKDPAPVVAVSALADSSINFVCRPWVKTPDYWEVYWDITEKVKVEFDANEISIPFPQRDVHVHQVA